MTKPNAFSLRAGPVALSLLALTACGWDEPRAPVPGAPTAVAPRPVARPEAPRPQPLSEAPASDSRGVIDYGDYAVVQARPGDTLEAMAARVGLRPSELAAYNGLPTGYRPRPGDELVLPPRAEGYAAAAPAPEPAPAPAAAAPAPEPAQGWNPAAIGAAIERAPGPDASGQSAPAANAPGAAPAADVSDGGTRIVYRTVKPGETVYSIARETGVPADAIISWNGLRAPSYAVMPGQVLALPADAPQKPRDEAPARVAAPGAGAGAPPPAVAGAPLPADTVPPPRLKSPQLSRYQTPAERAAEADARPEPAPAPRPAAEAPPEAPGATPPKTASETAAPGASQTAKAAEGKLMRPIDGPIVLRFGQGGPAGRNDGIEIAARPGDPVRAAADGEVALVSKSLGDWGTIVLVRHPDRLMTVYGRLADARVSKGQRVTRGQTIGTVAEGDPTTLHFEVRRGAFSEDPEKFF
ncbi:LysM peptidoglycan-binding domain-containing protein [Oceanicella actignis]|uniref:Murein DD-endopeptidase MepM and murein hydrolase activator NlpD, contain LysM domain n=1 Tax=Oceanicella actignis TaxID=1189325 RepID=A0A1M7RWA2_9RHOB|nr:LysM peptidoglycan-binding domain-containing protein [Oceanicella actignis]SET00092.1 Murein DD-endopeptidase MepM and murein hydrolase activator NlpD, contain LysM domain [Oceanicella actignis]SHN50510.1 Murein DD-endopeptidase MepM and murein hydrolase activator NlpD, contain LysM domain [Oceanicella actignis]